MECPVCHKVEIKTLETRECSSQSKRRRKICGACGKRFTTYEHIEHDPITVVKNDGSRQPFEREKVLAGVRTACEKRPITEQQMQDLVDSVFKKVLSREQVDITSKRIGLYVVNRLKKLDSVAYMRFASVYRGFRNVEQFENEVNKFQKSPQARQTE